MPRPSDTNISSEPQLRSPIELQRSGEQGILELTGEIGLREWVTQLWVRHQALLVELANYHLRDRDRAQEVVQDTWVDFLKSLGRFEGRCSPKTWLVQILRRRVKKELRRTILRRAREALLGVGKVQSYDDYETRAVPYASLAENPEKAFLLQERLEYIWRVSRALPERQAEVWMLRDLFQWTSEEVSTSLNISQENQRILLHRARQRLKLEVERHFGKKPTPQSDRAQSHDL